MGGSWERSPRTSASSAPWRGRESPLNNVESDDVLCSSMSALFFVGGVAPRSGSWDPVT
ncbi:hypothetical protein F751_3328 [Auxenochlorella protothecoides]|uniref:Uncharacterized protein n=1 Tax=Auxenochlorella protothecoides TaxID=3075 RepID=A0A087SBN3_AUXPR|nr:hypothetical protein F751_3328 [Auxenochlorella protothecoides]KFM23137.1 hypothetical protein F751_3328 [Auxenochlorella protothecoides]